MAKKRRTIFSHTILDKINKKARENFPEDLLRSSTPEGILDFQACNTREDFDENFLLYQKEWFKAAEAIYNEFEAEGLTNTCTEIRRLIDEQKRYANHV